MMWLFRQFEKAIFHKTVREAFICCFVQVTYAKVTWSFFKDLKSYTLTSQKHLISVSQTLNLSWCLDNMPPSPSNKNNGLCGNLSAWFLECLTLNINQCKVRHCAIVFIDIWKILQEFCAQTVMETRLLTALSNHFTSLLLNCVIDRCNHFSTWLC